MSPTQRQTLNREGQIILETDFPDRTVRYVPVANEAPLRVPVLNFDKPDALVHNVPVADDSSPLALPELKWSTKPQP